MHRLQRWEVGRLTRRWHNGCVAEVAEEVSWKGADMRKQVADVVVYKEWDGAPPRKEHIGTWKLDDVIVYLDLPLAPSIYWSMHDLCDLIVQYLTCKTEKQHLHQSSVQNERRMRAWIANVSEPFLDLRSLRGSCQHGQGVYLHQDRKLYSSNPLRSTCVPNCLWWMGRARW